MLRILCDQTLEAQSERLDEHVGDRTFCAVARPLVHHMICPEFVGRPGVLPVPGLQSVDADLPQERLLQRVFASKGRCQLDIGHRAKDQSIAMMPRQASRRSDPEVRIVESDVQQYRSIHQPARSGRDLLYTLVRQDLHTSCGLRL